ILLTVIGYLSERFLITPDNHQSKTTIDSK
ncbi:MAG TPA: CidA/LrgA family protein, partial [Colwellia sp.]|nr:CidA/LrgA family protein [Colwellia sp.]